MTFADQSIEEFLDRVASESLTPSAGAVAAVTGAAGAALCEMVCLHTVRKGGDEGVETELVDIGEQFEAHRRRLLALADEDSAAVEGVRSAFDASTEASFDASTEASPLDRQEALRHATDVPLEIAETCLAVLDHAPVVIADGTRNARADAVTGAYLAHAAIRSSLGLVRDNLGLLDETQVATETSERVAELEDAARRALDRVEATVEADG